MDAPPAHLDRRREEFPTLAGGIHLLSHSLGPMPRGARAALEQYAARWEGQLSEDAWASHWWELSERVGDGIGALLGAAKGSVLPLGNATLAMATAASCFDFGNGRRRVVTTALDFPSMGYFWGEQQRAGAEVHIVPSADGIRLDTGQLLAAIDERTALVAVSHVSYRSSFRLDVPALVQRAHSVGAKVLLDVYQSTGVLELDATGWGVDFMIGGTIKWLCGGPACGYLYVRPDLREELRPRLTGWIAHEQPFAFASGAQSYDAGMRRFAQGTPNIPGLHSTLAGLELMNAFGTPLLAAENRRRTRWMVEAAQERGWRLHCPTDVDERGPSVMIHVDDPQPLVAKLAARGLGVDGRPGVGLRLSPHVFNTDDEVRAAYQILDELLA